MIGRQKEVDELIRMYESDESEFVAVYGRRRVGKTYLIRETFADRFAFRHAGLADEGLKNQLKNFHQSLLEAGCSVKVCPRSWIDAFALLKKTLGEKGTGRKIVFIDEMPWLDTPRSGFVSALEAFWNGWASARKDILLIVCGSAASWMVKNLLRNRGGLHNRVTCRIRLLPFTLGECEAFVKERGLAMTRLDIAECYMALGGIPYYWRYLDKRFGVAENIDRLFFVPSAPLGEEFVELYASLFKNAALHKKVVEALATKKVGMTLAEVAEAIKVGVSGKLTEVLANLEWSGFIRKYAVFGSRKKNAVYQLMDNFTLFHFRFLTGASNGDPHFWTSTVSSPIQHNWRGLSFEMLCLQHGEAIRKALGVGGVHVGMSAWRHVGDAVYPQGAQIDLLIDRSDNVINVCEMKYSAAAYALDKKEADRLVTRMETFRVVSKTKKALHLTLVTPGGVVHNSYWHRIQSTVTLDDLFVMV